MTTFFLWLIVYPVIMMQVDSAKFFTHMNE